MGSKQASFLTIHQYQCKNRPYFVMYTLLTADVVLIDE